MKILNILKRKLPEHKVIWCIAIPYTEQQFYSSYELGKNSDFLESLELKYATNDKRIIWSRYKTTADKIYDCVKKLANIGVTVRNLYSVKDLKSAFDYEVVIITAHRHRYLDCFDFMGNPVPFNDVSEVIPLSYNGTIDISSCYSSTFQMAWKKKNINATYIAANTESSIDIRLFLYEHTIKYLISHPFKNYLDALEILLKRMESGYNANKTRQDVFLGGTVNYSNCGSMSASAFAPSEVAKGEKMIIQIYVYKDVNHESIVSAAKATDEDTVERCNVPLNFDLHNGDLVKAEIKVLGLSNMRDVKCFAWSDRTAKLFFNIEIPENFSYKKCFVEILISVNEVPLGELCFATKLVNTASHEFKDAEIISRKFKKVFISYSHIDEDKVKYIDHAYEAIGIDHFFDRRYLKTGDIYPLKIKEYIESADLFVLCWSENASKSDYVNLELSQALKRAYPNIEPTDRSQISLYPLCIEPCADLPATLKDNYNFGL